LECCILPDEYSIVAGSGEEEAMEDQKRARGLGGGAVRPARHGAKHGELSFEADPLPFAPGGALDYVAKMVERGSLPR
jgi:hypothetical protein